MNSVFAMTLKINECVDSELCRHDAIVAYPCIQAFQYHDGNRPTAPVKVIKRDHFNEIYQVLVDLVEGRLPHNATYYKKREMASFPSDIASCFEDWEVTWELCVYYADGTTECFVCTSLSVPSELTQVIDDIKAILEKQEDSIRMEVSPDD